MELKQIGVIHSPYKTTKEAPKQGKFEDTVSEIEIFNEYKAGLTSVEQLSHLIVLYWGNQADRSTLKTKPHGVLKQWEYSQRDRQTDPTRLLFALLRLQKSMKAE